MKALLAISLLLCATSAIAQQQPSQVRVEAIIKGAEGQRDRAHTDALICIGSLAELQAENAALKKELDSLKPKDTEKK